MKNNNLIKLFNRQKSSAGYTLIELLIGASISVVVIGAAGIGLMNLMRGNLAATNQAERREEVNRALEFISDEVRRAETIELNPSSIPAGKLPTGFDSTKDEVVLALDVPENLGQARPGDKVIYYVGEKPDSKWIGPNVIYRYGPPLDTSGGSYTAGDWVNQPLIDRVNDQILTPTCSTEETPIEAEGFAACVDTDSEKIARVYVNGQFSQKPDDEYQADIKVFARSEAVKLSGTSSTVTFNPTPPSPNPEESTVKVLASEMGCSSSITDYNNGSGKCNITTDFTDKDGNTLEFKDSSDVTVTSIDGSGEFTGNIAAGSTFVVTVTPSATHLGSNAFPSYFDDYGNPQAGGEQNNNKAIQVKIDLSKDYLYDRTKHEDYDPDTNPDPEPEKNPVTVLDNTDFSLDQVKLLGDNSNLDDLDSWNLEEGGQQTNFDKLKKILTDNGLIDTITGNLKLESGQYILVFEVGQKDTDHKGFDLQDHIMLITTK